MKLTDMKPTNEDERFFLPNYFTNQVNACLEVLIGYGIKHEIYEKISRKVSDPVGSFVDRETWSPLWNDIFEAIKMSGENENDK